MKYNNIDITVLSLDELEKADWELGEKEFKFNESLSHSKFKKLFPKPQLGEAFVKLRTQIKEQIEKKKENTNGN